MSEFRNPYNFIPLGKPMGGLLRQDAPAGHDRYHEDKWSGRITVQIETLTPLLIPDAASAEVERSGNAKGHKTFDIRKSSDGFPLLPVTAVKGVLRSAFEAVTNSRLGVFGKHKVPFRRMKAREALALVPVRIVKTGQVLNAELLTGTNGGLPRPKRDAPLYAAWLPLRPAVALRGWQTTYRHGDAVTIRVERVIHPRCEFWEVVDMAPGHGATVNAAAARNARYRLPNPAQRNTFNGYVFRSGRNIDRKHDERVFLIPPGGVRHRLPLAPEVIDRWQKLIADYKDPNRRSGPPLVRSHHVTSPGSGTLNTGDLCYALLGGSPGALHIAEIYPVMISRDLGWQSPAQVLPEDLHPAPDFDHFSPADRVFGWVRQGGKGGKGAYKGQLRIRSVDCNDENAIETFNNPLPLAILGQPKISQSRFYVGKGDGLPLDRGADTATAAISLEPPRKLPLPAKGLSASCGNGPYQGLLGSRQGRG